MQIDSWFWLFWLWLDRKQWLRYGLLVHRPYLPFGWGCLCEILQQDTAIGLHDHGSRPEGIRLGGEYSWSIPGSTLLGLVQHILPWRQIICQGTWWLLVVGFVSPSSPQPLVSNLGWWFDMIWLGFTLFWCLAQPQTRLRKLSQTPTILGGLLSPSCGTIFHFSGMNINKAVNSQDATCYFCHQIPVVSCAFSLQLNINGRIGLVGWYGLPICPEKWYDHLQCHICLMI